MQQVTQEWLVEIKSSQESIHGDRPKWVKSQPDDFTFWLINQSINDYRFDLSVRTSPMVFSPFCGKLLLRLSIVRGLVLSLL